MKHWHQKTIYVWLAGTILIVVVAGGVFLWYEHLLANSTGRSLLHNPRSVFGLQRKLNTGGVSIEIVSATKGAAIHGTTKTTSCDSLPSDTTPGYRSFFGWGSKESCLSENPSGYKTLTLTDPHEGESLLTISIKAKNETDGPINLDKYSFYPLADIGIDDWGQDIKAGSVIPKSTVDGTVTGYIKPDYSGPISLEVVKGSSHKTIVLHSL